MRIGGILDISTKDVPNKAAMVIFTVGCNLGCQFCHNKELLNRSVGRIYNIDEIVNRVKSNNLISAVSITGGEPTLQTDLIDICKAIKKLDIFLSIDTNGTNPKIIESLLPHIDRIALDLKSPLNESRMEDITRSKKFVFQIKKTIDLTNRSDIDFEIRTTYVANLMKPHDIHMILNYLNEKNFRGIYVLQQYQYSEGVGEKVKNKFEKPNHTTLIDILTPYVGKDLSFMIYIRDDVSGYREVNDIV